MAHFARGTEQDFWIIVDAIKPLYYLFFQITIESARTFDILTLLYIFLFENKVYFIKLPEIYLKDTDSFCKSFSSF